MFVASAGHADHVDYAGYADRADRAGPPTDANFPTSQPALQAARHRAPNHALDTGSVKSHDDHPRPNHPGRHRHTQRRIAGGSWWMSGGLAHRRDSHLTASDYHPSRVGHCPAGQTNHPSCGEFWRHPRQQHHRFPGRRALMRTWLRREGVVETLVYQNRPVLYSVAAPYRVRGRQGAYLVTQIHANADTRCSRKARRQSGAYGLADAAIAFGMDYPDEGLGTADICSPSRPDHSVDRRVDNGSSPNPSPSMDDSPIVLERYSYHGTT